MDLLRLQSRCRYGQARVASMMGQVVTQYRPTEPLSPLRDPYASWSVAVSSTADFSFLTPGGWGKPFLYGMMGTSDVLTGDILVGSEEVWFVAACDGLAPALLVACNHTVAYQQSGSSTVIAQDWPCAMVLRARGDRSESGTPGALTPGQFALYGPGIPGVELAPYMVVQAEDAMSYIVDVAERTSFGWRLFVSSQQV